VHSLVRPLKAPLTVAGHDLPAGVVLTLPIPLVHHDCGVFEDLEAFRPERFLDRPHPDAVRALRRGARRCLGQRLAELQMTTLVPAILSVLRLRPVTRTPERQIVRATVLPPHPECAPYRSESLSVAGRRRQLTAGRRPTERTRR
jgi:cytochrome P450